MANLLNSEGCQVTGQRLSDIQASFIGSGDYISCVGNQMSATIQNDNNTVRVFDGLCFSEGRPVQIEASAYDDFTIPNGTQGTVTTYYIGYRIYSGSGGAETCEKKVSTAKTTAAGLRSGGSEQYIWLYSVKRNGVTLESLERLISVYQPSSSSSDNLYNTERVVGIYNGKTLYEYILSQNLAGWANDSTTAWVSHQYQFLAENLNVNIETVMVDALIRKLDTKEAFELPYMGWNSGSCLTRAWTVQSGGKLIMLNHGSSGWGSNHQLICKIQYTKEG